MMTGIERINNILKRKPVDRIGLYESFWGETGQKWMDDGSISAESNLFDLFDYDMHMLWAFNMKARLDFENEIIEETDETKLVRDGNGALLRWHKLHSTTPEHVDFLVKEREDWETHIKPYLTPDRKRIDFESYRYAKRWAAERNRFFVWSGLNVFELMHPVCGHENMLVGMALDPDWIRDMVDTYAKLTVELQEILFAEEGYPDGIWYYEDMGFKEHPFISPTMYKELIQPGHLHTIGFAKSHKLPVIMHSCGMVEPLVPGMLESGIDCLQAIEIKAGMDLLRLYKNYGDVLSFMGGIDVRTISSNDKAIVLKELESKIPFVKEKFGYVLHSDHSIPNSVNYEAYKFFVEKGLELGSY